MVHKNLKNRWTDPTHKEYLSWENYQLAVSWSWSESGKEDKAQGSDILEAYESKYMLFFNVSNPKEKSTQKELKKLKMLKGAEKKLKKLEKLQQIDWMILIFYKNFAYQKKWIFRIWLLKRTRSKTAYSQSIWVHSWDSLLFPLKLQFSGVQIGLIARKSEKRFTVKCKIWMSKVHSPLPLNCCSF